MENATIYDATIFKYRRWVVVAIPTCIVVSLIIILLCSLAHSFFMAMGFFFSFVIAMFVFQKKLFSFLSDKAEMVFDDTGVLIKEYKKDSTLTTTSTINWAEIKSYRFRFGTGAVTSIAIKLKTRKTVNFSFTNEKYQNDSPDKVSVYSVFTAYVETYNSSIPPDQQIINNSLLIAVDPYPGIEVEVRD